MSNIAGWLKRLLFSGSMARQILFYFLIVAAVVFLLMGGLAYSFAHNRIRSDLKERFNNVASLTATDIGLILDNSVDDINALAHNPVIASPTASAPEKQKELNDAQQIYGLFDDITLLDINGMVEMSTTYSYVGYWQGRESFRQALAGKTYAEDPQRPDPAHPDRVAMILSAPIVNQSKQVVAVIAAQMNMEHIWQITGSVKVGDTGYVSLVNGFGRYIAHPNNTKLFNSIALSNNQLSNEHAKLLSYKESGKNQTGLLEEVTPHSQGIGKGWKVVVSEPTGEAFRDLTVAKWGTIGGLLAALALFAVAGLLVSRRLAKPIHVLAEDTERTAKGDFSHQISINRSDEIGKLTQAYNNMASKLAQRESAREQFQLLKKLESVTRRLTSILSLAELSSALTKATSEVFDNDSACLLLTNGKRLEAWSFSSRQPAERQITERTLKQDIAHISFDMQTDLNLFTRVFKSGQPVFLDQLVLSEEGVVKDLLGTSPGAVAIVPLILDKESIGVLGIMRPKPFSHEERQSILIFAHNCAIIIDNTRLYETAQRQTHEKSRLYELAGLMSSSLEPKEVFDLSLEAALSLVPSPLTAWAVLTSFDEESWTFTYEATKGEPDIMLTGIKVPLGESWKKQLDPLLKGNIITSQDITALPEDKRFPFVVADLMRKIEIRSLLLVPLRAKGRFVGTLRIINKLPLLPSPEQQEALRNLATNIAIAMENARLYNTERQRATELQNLERLKTDFMLAISHELKTPLTSIKASGEMLQEQLEASPGTPVGRLLSNMVNSTEKLNRLVSDLLEAARLESTAIKLELEFIDIVPMIKTAAGQMMPLMESHNQSFAMDIPSGGLWARVDLNRLEQVVTNLLSNAQKFTPKGGNIRLRLWERGDDFLLEVTDTGRGMNEEEQQRIFEPFYRAKGVSRDSGSGLGLTIARRLVELHGGRITVRSQPDKGTTFIVSIPKGAKEYSYQSALYDH